jgi:hypothetical protein
LAAETTPIDYDALQAAAVQRLLKHDRPEAALALAESTIGRISLYNDGKTAEVDVLCPGDAFDALSGPEINAHNEDMNDFNQPYEVKGTSLLSRVFTDVLPPRIECWDVRVKVRNDPVPDTWRDDLKASMGRGPVNQGSVPGIPPGKYLSSDGLRYRSKTEMVIAEELKRRKIIFFPLPAAVIGGKAIREPDFVLIDGARVGVLEIHGEPWHPPSRAAEENAQAMPYRLAGAIHLIVDSKEAYNAPSVVIDKLLALMRGPHRSS